MINENDFLKIKKKVELVEKNLSGMLINFNRQLEQCNKNWKEKNDKYGNQEKLSNIMMLKRQTQLEEYIYNRNRIEAEITKMNLYLKSCDIYLKYTQALFSNNEIEAKKYKYQFDEIIIKRAFNLCDTKILDIKQMNLCREVETDFQNKLNTVDSDEIYEKPTNLKYEDKEYYKTELQKWMEIKEKLHFVFSNKSEIEKDLLLDPKNYLNYDILEVVANLYPSFSNEYEDKNISRRKVG